MNELENLSKWPDRIAMVALIVGAFLILCRVSDRVLWEDEAETAAVAVNVLKYGYPRMYDGKNLITQDNGNKYTEGEPIFGREYNEHYAECYHPWLQHYITAASISVLGRTTLGARLPFALLGIAGMAVSWLVARKLFKDPWIPALAAVLLATHVPYILHMRQCRYYALLPILTVGMVYFYLGAIENRRRAWIGFTACSILLFHSHYLVFGSTIVGLLVHFVCFVRKRQVFTGLVISGIVTLAFTLPWFLYAQPYNHTTPTGTLDLLWYRLYTYLTLLNQGVFPFVYVPLLIALFVTMRRSDRGMLSMYALFAIVILAVALGQIVNLTATRNLMGVVPLGVMLIASCFRMVWKWSRPVAVTLLLVTCLTDFPEYMFRYARSFRSGVANSYVSGIEDFPSWSRSFVYYSSLAALGYEVTHDYRGSNERVVEYLKANASPGDVVLTNYDWDVIVYYTDLKVANRILDPTHPDYLKSHVEWEEIDWLVVRKHWPTLPGVFPKDWISRVKLEFDAINLGVHDLPWNGTPQFHYHHYIAPRGHDIILFRRKALNNG